MQAEIADYLALYQIEVPDDFWVSNMTFSERLEIVKGWLNDINGVSRKEPYDPFMFKGYTREEAREIISLYRELLKFNAPPAEGTAERQRYDEIVKTLAEKFGQTASSIIQADGNDPEFIARLLGLHFGWSTKTELKLRISEYMEHFNVKVPKDFWSSDMTFAERLDLVAGWLDIGTRKTPDYEPSIPYTRTTALEIIDLYIELSEFTELPAPGTVEHEKYYDIATMLSLKYGQTTYYNILYNNNSPQLIARLLGIHIRK